MKPRTVAIGVGATLSLALLAGVLPTAHAAEATPDPFFGTWSDGLTLTEQDRQSSQQRLSQVAGSGAGLVRQYVWWDRIETSPGTYHWARMDELVEDATERGVQILPTLLYPPAFYSSKPAGSDSSALFPPQDPKDMADFAEAMVKRYGTHGSYWGCELLPVVGWQCDEPYVPITMWEVWNEPDYPSWWKGAPDPAEYLALLKATHGAIKQADPGASVVLGSMTNSGGGTTDGYLEQLYKLGGKDYFDVLSLNPYARDVGAMMAFIHGERAVATRYGDGAKPLLVTEYGWATKGRQPYIVTGEDCQAALLYAATEQLSKRRKELNLLALTQFQWQDVETSSTAWPHHAGVIRADGTAKPSLAALRAAIAGEPVPTGFRLADACPADRRSLDGQLQTMTTKTSGSGAGAVKSSPSGISCGADCSHEFQPGTVVTLTATPEKGSRVAWRGARCSGTECTVTMDADRAVETVFARAAGPGAHQERSRFVSYTGKWVSRKSAKDMGGGSTLASRGSATATLSFLGAGVRWISRTGPGRGIGRVYVDGVRVANVDLYSSRNRHRIRAFGMGGLGVGEHTIRVEYTGRKDRRAKDDSVPLDAFVVR